MRIRLVIMSISAATLFVTGCQNMQPQALMQSGAEAFRALTLSDAQVKQLSDESCQQADKSYKIAPASGRYQQRLNKISMILGNRVGDTSVNYKAYLTQEKNAWAMANGCIRVYSGLMDIMTDDELAGIIAHEIGHVELGHSRKAMQMALGTSAVRSAIASTNSTVGMLSQSQLGELTSKLINAQFSQSQESQADDYAYTLIKKRNLSTLGLATSLEKLSKLAPDTGNNWFSSHPAAAQRAQHIRALIAGDNG